MNVCECLRHVNRDGSEENEKNSQSTIEEKSADL